jgi:hypothetical protein
MAKFEAPSFEGHSFHLTKDTYEKMYEESINNPSEFYKRVI